MTQSESSCWRSRAGRGDAASIDDLLCNISCCLRPRIAFRVTGTPEAGPQLRPIQFSTTLSVLEAERGAYELRVRGWRKFHLLDVRHASASRGNVGIRGMLLCTRVTRVTLLLHQPTGSDTARGRCALTLPGLMHPLTTYMIPYDFTCMAASCGTIGAVRAAGGVPDGQPGPGRAPAVQDRPARSGQQLLRSVRQVRTATARSLLMLVVTACHRSTLIHVT